MNLLRPRSIIKRVRSEDDGHLAGLEREHWNDSQDAKAFIRAPRVLVGDGISTPGLYAPGIGMVVQRERRPWRGIRDLARTLHRNEIGTFASGIYGGTLLDVFDASQLVIDLSLTTHKWAMYTNTLTPNFDAAAPAYSATNEVAANGDYAAGGKTITSPTTAIATTVLTYDMADQVWNSPTTVTARGAIEYADAITTPTADPLIVASNFGADITSTAGTFTIAWNAAGVFTIDYA